MRLLALPVLLGLASAAAASSPDPKSLDVPPEQTALAKELVRKLDSPAYADREEAHERLAKMGRLARAVLSHALVTDPSAEVQARCRDLLPQAAADDLKARLDTFLADAEGKYQHDVDGWNEFRTVTGNTPAARSLFVDLIADPTNRALVLATGAQPGELGALVAARKTELYGSRFPRSPPRRDISASDVTALLFAESFAASRQSPRSVTPSALFGTPGLSLSADGDDRARATRAIVSKWIVTRDDPAQLSQLYTPALSYGFRDEVAVVAARLLESKDGTSLYRASAALALARAGATDRAAVLEKQLADRSAVVVGRLNNPELETRDAALAALLLLSGQSPDEYGFTEHNAGSSATRYLFSNYALPEAHREAAHERWRAWRAKHPDWGKPKR